MCCVWFKGGVVLNYAVGHVDGTFTGETKSRCDRFCDDLNRLVPINNLGDLTWYGVCHYSRDRKNDLLSMSQNAFADKVVDTYGVALVIWVPASTIEV